MHTKPFDFKITSQLTIINDGVIQNDAELVQRVSGHRCTTILKESGIWNELEFKVQMCYELIYEKEKAAEMAKIFLASSLNNCLLTRKPTSLKIEHEGKIRILKISCGRHINVICR